MIRHLALLRGVNLGQRQVKSADLKAAFEAMGFANVKTILASGNVLFDAAPAAVGQKAIEDALAASFGFPIGTVLRTQDEIRALLAADPFKGRKEDHDTKLYVTFLADKSAKTLPMPNAIAGDYEVVQLTNDEVFILAFRMPNGRFGAGMEQIWKHFGNKRLWTSRNFNTVVKAAA
ncbi:DUF1697 domain-containing protein [Devosia sp. A449]